MSHNATIHLIVMITYHIPNKSHNAPIHIFSWPGVLQYVICSALSDIDIKLIYGWKQSGRVFRIGLQLKCLANIYTLNTNIIIFSFVDPLHHFWDQRYTLSSRNVCEPVPHGSQGFSHV